MSQTNYDTLRDELAAALRQDREAQLHGDEGSIGRRYEELDGRIPRDGAAAGHRLLEALCFWDYWIDARNHNWTPFYDVTREQWPVLAEHVTNALTSGRRISEPRVLRLVGRLSAPPA